MLVEGSASETIRVRLTFEAHSVWEGRLTSSMSSSKYFVSASESKLGTKGGVCW